MLDGELPEHFGLVLSIAEYMGQIQRLLVEGCRLHGVAQAGVGQGQSLQGAFLRHAVAAGAGQDYRLLTQLQGPLRLAKGQGDLSQIAQSVDLPGLVSELANQGQGLLQKSDGIFRVVLCMHRMPRSVSADASA